MALDPATPDPLAAAPQIIADWVSANLGAKVTRIERQGRWRPAWYVDAEKDGAALPLYVRGYVDPNAPIDALIAIEGFGVISTTVLIAWLTKKWRPLPAMAVGVAITAVAWLILLLGNGSLFIAATLFVIALGEALQASRFYEYCSRLAPKGQEGVFMGYAFLPIAIGFLIAGQIGGRLVRYFGDVRHEPAQLWIVVCAIGLATALALVIYDRVVMREPAQST